MPFRAVNSKWLIVNRKSKSSGFTLVELLVVLGILAVTVGVALVFLTSVLRGTNQANIIGELKQNGQVVLDSLERQIRNAKSASVYQTANQPPGSSSHIILKQPDNSNIHLVCFTPTLVGNGWIGVWQDPTGVGLGDAANLYASTTNKDPVGGVNVNICNVTVTTSTSSSPSIVSISFTMQQGRLAPSRKDYVASLEFKTTISLRQY